jgi:hypothetical protein
MEIPLKVLHAPATVGGNAGRLAQSEKSLGISNYCITKSQNYFNYNVDEVLERNSRFKTLLNIFYWGLVRIWDFNVIHYNFGSTIFPAREVEFSGNPLRKIIKKIYYNLVEQFDLKLASVGKKAIFVTFQGDDARQGDYCRQHYKIHFAHEVGKDYYSDTIDKWKRERIEEFDRYADVIYAVNPDLLHVLPKKAKFLPYSGVDFNEWKPIWVHEGEDFTPHVIHAPSHRLVKGTSYIEAAVKRLQAEGVQLKFTLVEGMSNSEARKVYETADLVIDQLLAGYYGGLAMELMTLGKPAICYIREEDMVFLPKEMREEMPIINATPDTIYDVLKEWITIRKKELHQRGKDSRKYVERWHDPMKIAQIVKEDYERVLKEK